MTHSLTVIGAGILGCTAALLAARRGVSVRILERRNEPWSGASATGEGKVHLGLIYALGDTATQAHILQGALSFASVLDRAAGDRLPWEQLAGETFLNVVSPASLLSTDELAARYAELDAQYRASELSIDANYLGRPLQRLHEPGLVTESRTGLPALRVAERAIDPARLGRILSDQIRHHPLIELVTGRDVIALDDEHESVVIHHRDAGDAMAPITIERADAVLNCAWESQAALHDDPELPPMSIRYKASVSIPRDAIDVTACRSITIVLGAFGDVVRRADDVYVSWYPAGRVVHELGHVPSSTALDRVASLDATSAIVDEQLEALADLGALPRLDVAARRRATLTGGWILADGPAVATGADRGSRDVDDPLSTLHERHDGMIARRGRLFTPRNWKLSTAPLAAERAVAAVAAVLDEGA